MMSHPIAAEDLVRITLRAGDLAVEDFGRCTFDVKDDGSPVTETDRRVERLLREELERVTPDVPILGEELGGRVAAEGWAWAVDPIDGTRAYVSGIPTWCVSVGLLRDGEPSLGCIVLPAVRPRPAVFVGGEGVPLTRDGEPAGAARPETASQVCALVPSEAHRHFRLRFPGRVRSLGSTAYHLALVATGTAAAALVHEAHVWDVAAGMALLRAAGVPLARLDGSVPTLGPTLDGSVLREPLLAAPDWCWADVASLIEHRDVSLEVPAGARGCDAP